MTSSHRPLHRRASTRAAAVIVVALASAALGACGEDDPGTGPGGDAGTLATLGRGEVSARFTSELTVRGGWAYTGGWGRRGTTSGNKIHIWDVRGDVPALRDTVEVPDAVTLGDLQVSDDGALLVVATEPVGSLVIYSLADPARPQLVTRFTNGNLTAGVHTAQVSRVNGTQYVFASIDPGPSVPARLVVVDLSNPASPREVYARAMGNPFIHDVFVRDGYLFTALWNDGVTVWAIGAGGRGSPSAPDSVGNVRTKGGSVHNLWWLRDPASGEKRWLLVGEEGPGNVGGSSSGDVHVVDAADLAHPREVAFYNVPGAGTHNFSVDEANGILYAAYYNAGVRALDVRGDLGSCTAAQKAADGRCDLALMGRELARGLATGTTGVPSVFVWGVEFTGDAVFASDMLNGLWKLRAASR